MEKSKPLDKSKFLARALGVYLLVISSAMLINMPHFTTIINNMIFSPPIMFIVGCLTFILGILMVLNHNIWQWHWRVLVTIIAWIFLIKGASIIYFPERVDQLSLLFIQSTTFAYVSIAIDFILGMVLAFFGFRRR